jgi:hypothetical protein
MHSRGLSQSIMTTIYIWAGLEQLADYWTDPEMTREATDDRDAALPRVGTEGTKDADRLGRFICELMRIALMSDTFVHMYVFISAH